VKCTRVLTRLAGAGILGIVEIHSEDSTMTVRGHMQDGVVVLDGPVEIPEGTEVEVRPVPSVEQVGQDDEGPSLLEQFGDLVGSVEGLPPDAAENHDHYLYGVPKRR